MMEDCAPRMSELHGSTDDKVVVESFKEALKQRVGLDTFQAWFVNGVSFYLDVTSSETNAANSADGNKVTAGCLIVEVRRQFALDRLRRNFLRQVRGAAAHACGKSMQVELRLAATPRQVELPLEAAPELESQSDSGSESQSLKLQSPEVQPAKVQRRDSSQAPQPDNANFNQAVSKKPVQSIAALATVGRTRSTKRTFRKTAPGSVQPTLPNMPAEVGFPIARVDDAKQDAKQDNGSATRSDAPSDAVDATDSIVEANDKTPGKRMTLESFVGGKCNQLARTAIQMTCESPGSASILYLSGPPGVGKTHLLYAVAARLRRRQRTRKVIHLSAEKFTNDFIRSVSEHTLASFRARYRDVDALLIDDIQFLSAKKATLREMLYTIQWLSDRGKTMVFAGSHSPSEIDGMSQELSGRLASGLVCGMQALDGATREALLRQWIEQLCMFDWPQEIIHQVSMVMPGDGRRIEGLVRLVATLQIMFQRMPTMDEIVAHAGNQLRGDRAVVTLSKIEKAVRDAFQLDDSTLRSKTQARSATEPRMLAMYLSRELTPAALAEIGKHYGGRSHSAAILAIRRVESWLATGKPIGRGASAVSVRDALNRIEEQLRTG